MRFILTSQGMAPTDGAIFPFLIDKAAAPSDGAIIPNIVDHGVTQTKDMLTDTILNWTYAAGSWLVHSGVPILAELALIWGTFCFMIAITGSGKWLERGGRAMVVSVMLGLVRYAV